MVLVLLAICSSIFSCPTPSNLENSAVNFARLSESPDTA